MNYLNVAILEETEKILDDGSYTVGAYGKTVKLQLTSEEMCMSQVYLPDTIDAINEEVQAVEGKCEFHCINMDSYDAARRRAALGTEGRVLVLNLANPVNIGGGVRRGASAQEESLCRCSSLLRALEAPDAYAYYAYNRSLNTYMGSDAVIITPNVEIIRAGDTKLLDETCVAAVMTCAAPMVNTYRGFCGLTEDEYRNLIRGRIHSMLKVAAANGYRHIVFGAFGCGAFGNDAAVVSDLFREEIDRFTMGGYNVNGLFKTIEFAVLSKRKGQYNYQNFARNFER